MKDKVAVRFAGAAGDGIETVAEIMVKLCIRSGLHVYAYRGYQSAIRGGHVWSQIRISNNKLYSFGDFFDILVTLNKDGILYDTPYMSINGYIVHDPSVKFKFEDVGKPYYDINVPLIEFAKKFSRLPVVQNTVALGVVIYLLGLPFEYLKNVILDVFKDKGDEVINMNLNAALAGYEYAKEVYKDIPRNFQLNPDPNKRKFAMSGNQALAFGAYSAGCKFYAAYPMTPVSPILHWFAEHSKKCGIIVIQPEDEIAVINMAIGAAHAGVRAMVATSGGGFALMSESVSMAGMIEVPIVIVEGQRGAPSTGLPTKTEQGDLKQVLGAGQGSYPKIVLAPRSVEEAFYTAIEAFNLAEKYQVPVIIMTDLYLCESITSLEKLNLDIKIDRGWLVNEGEIKDYKRYMITETGVSPRALPGQKGYNFVAASDEHDEKGNLVSDVLAGLPQMLKIRNAMMEKRMRKEKYIIQEFPPPKLYGDEDADITIVCWGSTCSTVREAIEELNKEGIKANSLEIKYIHPFQAEEVKNILMKAKRLLLVENNYGALMGKLITENTGILIKDALLRYDGEPITPLQIVYKVKEILVR